MDPIESQIARHSDEEGAAKRGPPFVLYEKAMHNADNRPHTLEERMTIKLLLGILNSGGFARRRPHPMCDMGQGSSAIRRRRVFRNTASYSSQIQAMDTPR